MQVSEKELATVEGGFAWFAAIGAGLIVWCLANFEQCSDEVKRGLTDGARP